MSEQQKIGILVKFLNDRTNKLSKTTYSYWIPLHLAKNMFHENGKDDFQKCILWLKNKSGRDMYSNPVVPFRFVEEPSARHTPAGKEIGIKTIEEFEWAEEYFGEIEGFEEPTQEQPALECFRQNFQARNFPDFKKNNQPKGENEMSNGMFKGLEFGKLTDMIGRKRVGLTMLGLAFLNDSEEAVVYDKAKDEYIEATLFQIGDRNTTDFIYGMPVAMNAVKEGDIILHQKTPVRVVEVHEKELKVHDYYKNEAKTIFPIKNLFGFNFYTKVICPFESMVANSGAANNDNPFGNMLPLMLLGKGGSMDNLMPFLLFGGGMENITANPFLMWALMEDDRGDGFGNSSGNSFFKDMMMMSMFMGKDNPFASMIGITPVNDAPIGGPSED